VYSGANPLLEYSPTDGTYLYRIYAGKKAVAEEKGGVVKFYHKDHLGSTRVVTNAAGVKIAEYKFAPYGEKEVASGDGTEYGFTDKAEDASTGLKYFGARFYDAEVGRWLNQDPARHGSNWFVYCNVIP
jgi:RHS repeat-associated protein